jgi:hypothetical protein
MNDFKRVGIALIKCMDNRFWPLQPAEPERLNEYGIYRYVGSTNYSGKEYLKYEGYRMSGWRFGLPLAGPNAAHSQPLIEFHPKNPDIQKTYFEEAAIEEPVQQQETKLGHPRA